MLGEGWYSENLGAAYPPTAYISMPRDAKTAERIAANLEELRGMGVPTDAILVRGCRRRRLGASQGRQHSMWRSCGIVGVLAEAILVGVIPAGGGGRRREASHVQQR